MSGLKRALVLATAGCVATLGFGGTASALDQAPGHHATVQKHPKKHKKKKHGSSMSGSNGSNGSNSATSSNPGNKTKKKNDKHKGGGAKMHTGPSPAPSAAPGAGPSGSDASRVIWPS
jgi:hypothetical protein